MKPLCCIFIFALGQPDFVALEREYQESLAQWRRTVSRNQATGQDPAAIPIHPIASFAPRIREVVIRSDENNERLAALQWLITNRWPERGQDDDNHAEWALQLTASEFARHPDVGKLLPDLQRAASRNVPKAQMTLEIIGDSHPDQATRTVARLALATAIAGQLNTDQADQPEDRQRAVSILEEIIERAHGNDAANARYLLERIDPVRPGTVAPRVTARDNRGRRIDLHSSSFRFTVVYFWGHWCADSVPAIELIHDLARKNANELRIVSVNTDLKSIGASIPARPDDNFYLVINGEPRRKDLSSLWRVMTFPTLFILDGNGVILERTTPGNDEVNGIQRQLERLNKSLRERSRE